MSRETDRVMNEQLDRVIADRRTVREFSDEVPPREQVERVLLAGMLAPYAAAAVGSYEKFRRFFVMEKGGRAMAEAARLIRGRVLATLEAVKQNAGEGVELPPFVSRLQAVADGAELGFESAPYFVVVAEKKGFPPIELESLAHVMENMWLKATALGLGFRLISATARHGDDPEFCGLLGIPAGEFGMVGCAIGYAVKVPPTTRRPSLEEATVWLD